ncbi:MAG: ribonuclease P protein subunit [Candidatus Hodarchaeota archaeon]
MINPKYLRYHDFIGIITYAKPISNSKDKNFSNIGIVIDETRNMLITKRNNKIKKFIKKDYVFRFKIPNYENDGEDYYLEVQGEKIVGLPMKRLRSLKKKRWLKK